MVSVSAWHILTVYRESWWQNDRSPLMVMMMISVTQLRSCIEYHIIASEVDSLKLSKPEEVSNLGNNILGRIKDKNYQIMTAEDSRYINISLELC